MATVSQQMFPVSSSSGCSLHVIGPEYEEPQDSGRTRSSSRRAANKANDGGGQTSTNNTSGAAAGKATSSNDGKGKKRKKKAVGEDGSDSEPEDGNDKKLKGFSTGEVQNQDEPVCSCPKNVMKCIGILPSLPIVSHFYDSDDSISSLNDDLNYIVLPAVSRNRPAESHNE